MLSKDMHQAKPVVRGAFKNAEFDSEFTKRIRDPDRVISAFLDELPDTPYFLKLRLLWKNAEWLQIIQWEFEPSHFNDATEAFHALSASSMLKKYIGFKRLLPTLDTKHAAFEKWLSAEESCRLTNERFRLYADGLFSFKPSVDSMIYRVRRKIARILSSCKLEDLFDSGNFGPGVDLGTKGFASPINKLRSAGHATPGLIRVMDYFHVFDWPVFEMMKTGAGIVPIIGTPSNRVTFVPKNAKTDRSIAIEPRWNIFFQKGAGDLIRRCLKKHGCDLNTQLRNQRLAKDLDYATIDLSNASDTLSRELVFDLLPVDWALALDSLRSPISKLPDGSVKVLEKFSSMGNGFTFELESLIFYAMASEVTEVLCPEREVSVFGDDIIVDVRCYETLVELLNVCGFSVNSEKSFHTGLYRESCGEHYFDGSRITPVYIKEEPHNVERLIGLANQIGRLAGSVSNNTVRDRRFWNCRKRVIRLIPSNLRFFGTADSGACIHSSVDEHCLPRHSCFEAFVAKVPVFVPDKMPASDLSLLYEKLLKPTNNGNSFSTRGNGKWYLKKVLVADDKELGPWV